MYSTPVQSNAVVVSPAAKALDYFQESLMLLGIDESEGITAERLKAGYRAASLRAHPDKGGTKEAFDEVVRAYKYVEKILLRVNPKMTAEEKARLTAPVTMENAVVFRERAATQTAGTAIVRKLEPDAIMPTSGTELGGDNSNFTAAFGADTQFMDLKEAYTTGSTRYQEVADVQVSGKSVRSIDEAKRLRDAAMARVDPDEKARLAAAAAAFEERERQRRMRLAQQDTAAESWAEKMRGRLFVSNS